MLKPPFFLFLAVLSTLIAPVSSALADCPNPPAPVQAIFDLIASGQESDAIDALMYSPVSVNANTRDGKCETIYFAAFRRNLPELLRALQSLGIAPKNPEDRDEVLGLTAAEYAYRFVSLSELRSAMAGTSELSNLRGYDGSLESVLVSVLNTRALGEFLMESPANARKVAAKLLEKRSGIDPDPAYASLLDSQAVEFIQRLRPGLRAKAVRQDLPLATLLGFLEAGDAPDAALQRYRGACRKLSPHTLVARQDELWRALRGHADPALVKDFFGKWGTAAWANDAASARYLLADPEVVKSPELSRLLLATDLGKQAVQKAIGGSLFWYALSEGNIEMIKALVAAGESLSNDPGNGPPLTLAVGSGNVDLIRALVKLGAPVNPRDKRSTSALMAAVNSKQFAIASYLLSVGADPSREVGGTTPLMSAFGNQDEGMVALLLQHGANPNSPAGEGFSRFYSLVEHGNLEMVKLLVDHHLDLKSPGGYYEPALYHALRYGQLEVAAYLISAKVSLDAQDPASGRTALHYAVSQIEGRDNPKLKKIVELLLAGGADRHLKDHVGREPWQLGSRAKLGSLYDALKR